MGRRRENREAEKIYYFHKQRFFNWMGQTLNMCNTSLTDGTDNIVKVLQRNYDCQNPRKRKGFKQGRLSLTL